MISDGWAATAASSEIVPANEFRDSLTIQSYGDEEVCLAFGKTAVFTQGLTLQVSGDAVTVNGWLARLAVYAICDGGNICTGGYQEGGHCNLALAGIVEVVP